MSETAEKKLVFAATGKFENFTRDTLKTFIEEHGHILLDKISAKANYLINNDVISTSGKNKFAKENQIPIISEIELIDLIEQKSVSDSNIDVTVSHNLDVNFNDLLGYYNKFPSGNGKLAKIVYLDDVLIDVAKLTFEFSIEKQAYATCDSMVQEGDFLLLNDHQIVLVSAIVDALESHVKNYSSIAYYKKCLKDEDETNHHFGIFYAEVDFDVEDQSFAASGPNNGFMFFSEELKNLTENFYQSYTLIFNSYFGFASVKDDSESNDDYHASYTQVNDMSINENFWDTYAEMFESSSKYGIPHLSDLDYINKDQLKTAHRINQLFPNEAFIGNPFYTYSHWEDVDKIENSIGREISSLLSICFAATKSNSLSSTDVTHVIDGRPPRTINDLKLENFDPSLLLFKGNKELLIVCYSKDEYELIASYNSSNGFALIDSDENQSYDNLSEDVPVEQGYVVEVKFDSNKVYKYNSKVRVNLGDVVSVSGKVDKEGTVVSVKNGWDDNFYMQEITDVIKSNLTTELPEESITNNYESFKFLFSLNGELLEGDYEFEGVIYDEEMYFYELFKSLVYDSVKKDEEPWASVYERIRRKYMEIEWDNLIELENNNEESAREISTENIEELFDEVILYDFDLIRNSSKMENESSKTIVVNGNSFQIIKINS
jgi:hypothetical protein